MSTTVDVLIDLRNRTLDDYLDGRISKDGYRVDLGAITVELDGLLSPDSRAPLEERAARVVGRDHC